MQTIKEWASRAQEIYDAAEKSSPDYIRRLTVGSTLIAEGLDETMAARFAERVGLAGDPLRAPTMAQLADTLSGREDLPAEHECEQCGREARWNDGAGRPLCSRHWDNY